MSDPIEITINGADILARNLDKFRDQIKLTMQAAAAESAAEIIASPGLRTYPPETKANKPPTPYYIRGVGMQYKSKNNMKSEKYGSKFYVKKSGYGVIIGNSASYAKYLTDEDLQARAMERIGWRKLIEVAREKLDVITGIFNRWVEYTIDKLGL